MPYIDSIKLLEAGAKGCVWKTSHPAKLNRAIDSISNGYTYFDSVHMDCEKISSRYSSDNQLTNRESEILQLIADGKTNKEIANFLQLSRKTVETHTQYHLEIRCSQWYRVDQQLYVWVCALYKRGFRLILLKPYDCLVH